MANYADPGTFTVTSPSKVQPGAVLVLMAGIAALCFCVAAFVYTSSLKNQSVELDKTINQDEARLTQLKPVSSSLSSYSSIADNLTGLFASQYKWENVLQTVEGRLYKKMRVTSLQLSDDGQMVLAGVTPSYTDYARVYSSLTDSATQEYISNIQVVSVSQPDPQNNGAIQFSFKGVLTNKALSGQL